MKCLQPSFGCYCAHVREIDPLVSFVILIHPIEMRRRVATGKLSHRCLKNSHLILGHDFSENTGIDDLISEPGYFSVILYPGRKSVNLTSLSPAERISIFPKTKKLRLFVIDGTWGTARTMMNHSSNLQRLPMVAFTPSQPSTFRVRRQPREGCVSTIEAIHQAIELVGPSQGFNTESREHDKLLEAFDSMIETELRRKER